MRLNKKTRITRKCKFNLKLNAIQKSIKLDTKGSKLDSSMLIS